VKEVVGETLIIMSGNILMGILMLLQLIQEPGKKLKMRLKL
jgi:hypothetical protein